MSPTVLAIDPGPTHSAYVLLRGREVVRSEKMPNEDMIQMIGGAADGEPEVEWLVIEMIQSFGDAVGAEVFETCVWIGRFMGVFDDFQCARLNRHEIKMHLCHATKGVNDSVIRQRLIDLYGGKETAIGNKKKPGPLYGIKGDCWQALAVGYVWLDKHANNGASVCS